MMSLRAVGFTVFIVAAAAAVSCGGEPGSDAPTAQERPEVRDSATAVPSEPIQQELVISQRGDPLTLDPYDENETPTLRVLCNIFDPLVDMGVELDLVPALAASWEIVDDLTWDFRLQEGVQFHSGSDFTADDVVYSLNRARFWDGSEVRGEIATIADVTALDDLTVRITTINPDPILLRRLTGLYIMDRESSERAIEEHGETRLVDHPDGTGAYRFVEWLREDHLTLEANQDHWRGAPVIPRVRFRPIGHDATRLAALLAGDVHLITDVPVRDTVQIENAAGLHLLVRESLRVIYLAMDCGREETPWVDAERFGNPFRDRRVREAIYLAIDEDAIVENVMNGFAVAASQLAPPAVFGHDPAIERPPHDPERARQLLAEAGYPDGFEVRLDAPNNRYVNDARIAQAIAGQLARVGIIVEVNARPKTIFFEDENQGELSFYLIGWANGNGDASGTFEYLLHTYAPDLQLGTSNPPSQSYSNPELDAVIQEQGRTVDSDQRLAILQRAMRLAMDDLPHIPLHYQVNLYGVDERVEWEPRLDTRLFVAAMRWL